MSLTIYGNLTLGNRKAGKEAINLENDNGQLNISKDNDLLLNLKGQPQWKRYLTIEEFNEVVNESKDTEEFYRKYIHDMDNLEERVNCIERLDTSDNVYTDYLKNKNDSIFSGVPIFVKSAVDVVRLPTTAGSIALIDNYPNKDAFIVHKLKKAGFVIPGNTNATPFGNWRGYGVDLGLSSAGGRNVNSYNPDFHAGSSSNGSGSIIAEGLCPVAIGCETNGSITVPAISNGVVGFKPSLGLVSRTGLLPIDSSQDTAGPLGRTVEDCAKVLQVIAGKDENDSMTNNIPSNFDFASLTKKDMGVLKGKKVAIVKPQFKEGDDHYELELRLVSQTKSVFAKLGAEIVDIDFAEPTDLTTTINENTFNFSNSWFTYARNMYVKTLESYLQKGNAGIKTLQGLYDYYVNNTDKIDDLTEEGHAEKLQIWNYCLSDTPNTYTEEHNTELRNFSRNTSMDYLDEKLQDVECIVDLARWKLFATHNRDEYITTSNGKEVVNDVNNILRLPALAGYPCMVVPLAMENGYPLSIGLVSKNFEDAKLLQIGHAFQVTNNFYPKPIIRN